MGVADITVVTPSIPPRLGPRRLLDRAVQSVREQTLRPAGGHVVVLDVNKEGAAVTRQRGLNAVRTEWVAFLDDDDYFYPQHLEVLYDMAISRDAVYCYSWFDGNNPFPGHRGKQMNLDSPHHTTMTVLVRTDIAKRSGFLQPDGPMHQDWSGEDWQFELRCLEQIKNKGLKVAGTGDVTWYYDCHGRNTSGLPSRW